MELGIRSNKFACCVRGNHKPHACRILPPFGIIAPDLASSQSFEIRRENERFVKRERERDNVNRIYRAIYEAKRQLNRKIAAPKKPGGSDAGGILFCP